jgi:hypothetical protein
VLYHHLLPVTPLLLLFLLQFQFACIGHNCVLCPTCPLSYLST